MQMDPNIKTIPVYVSRHKFLCSSIRVPIRYITLQFIYK